MLTPLFAAERRFEIRALYPFAACLIGAVIAAIIHADWWLAGIAVGAMLLNGLIGAGLEKNKAKSIRQLATSSETYETSSSGDLSQSDVRALSRTGFKFTALAAASAALISHHLGLSYLFALVTGAAGYFVSLWWWYLVAISRPLRRRLQTINQSTDGKLTGGELIEAIGQTVPGGHEPNKPAVTPSTAPESTPAPSTPSTSEAAQAKSLHSFKPPDDAHFQWLIEGALKGLIPVFGVVLETEKVALRRFDDTFRPELSVDGQRVLAELMRAWNHGRPFQPWLYPDGDNYIVADDYFWIAAIERGRPSSFAAQVLCEPLARGLIQKLGPLPRSDVQRMLGVTMKIGGKESGTAEIAEQS